MPDISLKIYLTWSHKNIRHFSRTGKKECLPELKNGLTNFNRDKNQYQNNFSPRNKSKVHFLIYYYAR